MSSPRCLDQSCAWSPTRLTSLLNRSRPPHLQPLRHLPPPPHLPQTPRLQPPLRLRFHRPPPSAVRHPRSLAKRARRCPPAPRPPPAAPRKTRKKIPPRRKRIAENLLLAQHSTAHLTTFNEIDMSALSALRERLKERVEKEHGVKLSFMPFFVKATCMALKSHPVVNAQIDGDSIIYKHYVNM